MKVYLLGDEGNIRAFEIENAFISPQSIGNILSRMEGVSEIAMRGFENPEHRLEFSFKGERFAVWEPFGDNSRYWLGPLDETFRDFAEIIEAFESYHPPFLIRVMGSMLTGSFLQPIAEFFKRF